MSGTTVEARMQLATRTGSAGRRGRVGAAEIEGRRGREGYLGGDRLVGRPVAELLEKTKGRRPARSPIHGAVDHEQAVGETPTRCSLDCAGDWRSIGDGPLRHEQADCRAGARQRRSDSGMEKRGGREAWSLEVEGRRERIN
ncbi:unnamed protein product [Linum trigynum]|uniref:Uncharacterized protein n=1 Tax=Linum trigynum TaxID=586398 RepID=A0AAV2E266_9ROSI